MNAAGILRAKGAEVITASPAMTVAAAAGVLDAHRIGAVIVVDEERAIVGVLSERDVTREIARRGAGALDLRVEACMTRDVITVGPKTELDELLACMTDRRIRHLPVTGEDDRLLGVVSIGDVVKWKIAETEAEAAAMRAYIATG